MAVTWEKFAFESDCVLVADVDASGYGFFLDEDNMVSNSAVKLASQQSIKAYVDAGGGGGGIAFATAATLGTL